IRHAFKCLFGTQERVGTWRHYAPLFHYPHSGNAYCYVFETFAVLLKEALKPEAEFVRSVLKQYFTPLVHLWQYATSTQTKRGKEALAWSSGHRNKPALESWATASVFAYAQSWRRLVGDMDSGRSLKFTQLQTNVPNKSCGGGQGGGTLLHLVLPRFGGSLVEHVHQYSGRQQRGRPIRPRSTAYSG